MTLVANTVIALIMIVLSTRIGGDMANAIGRLRPAAHYTITNAAAELLPLLNLMAEFLRAEPETEITRRTYGKALEYFAHHQIVSHGKRPASLTYSDITRAELVDFRASRLELGDAPASAELRLRAVKAFCSWMRRRYGVDSPAERIAPLTQEQDDFKGLTDSEYASMLARARALPPGPWRFVPLLLVDTGLRNNDARMIDLSQFSADGKWIMRVRTKGKKALNVPLGDAISQELTLYQGWRNQFPHGANTPLLVSTRGNRLDNKTIWRYVRDVGGDHPHKLRHTFALRYLRHLGELGYGAGESLILLRDRLGHGTVQTTLRYLTTESDDVWESVRELR